MFLHDKTNKLSNFMKYSKGNLTKIKMKHNALLSRIPNIRKILLTFMLSIHFVYD